MKIIRKKIMSEIYKYRLYHSLNEDYYSYLDVEASSEEEADEKARVYAEENNVVSFERIDEDKNPFEKQLRSSRVIKSSAFDYFPINEAEAEDVDNLKKMFPNVNDLRAALEDYFHIYDDYAAMSEEEFNKSFEEFIAK